MDPRRVVIFRQSLLPVSETFVAAQAQALAGWEPKFAGLLREPDGLGLPNDPLVLDRWHGTEDALFRGTGFSPRLHWLLRQSPTRLVHAHFLNDGARVLRAASYARRPLVVTAHGYDATTDSAHQLPLARLFRQAAALIAVSEFIGGRLRLLGAPSHKINVVYTGIEIPEESRVAPEGRDGVLFVGRLAPKKGCADVIAAMAGLPEPWRRTRLTIVGDGPLRRELERLAKDRRIDAHFLGARPPAEVYRLMSSARLFCIGSQTAPNGDSEGFGMVFLEAAAAGLPVVTYRSGGTPEAVADGHTGVLVPERDIAALSEAIEALLADPSRARSMGKAGRERVVDQFDIRRCTPRLEAVYDMAVGPQV